MSGILLDTNVVSELTKEAPSAVAEEGASDPAGPSPSMEDASQ